MNGIFVCKKRLNHDVWEFTLTPEEPLEYQAGQYVDVHFGGESRTFTLTTIPSDTELRFACKVPIPCSSFKSNLMALQAGDQVRISEAMGDMVLPRAANRPLLFIAGGLGIVSFVPLLQQCQEKKLAHEVSLLWTLRSESDKLPYNILDTFSFANATEFVSPNRLRMEEVLQHITPETDVYISGSEAFADYFVHELRKAGIPDTRLFFDYFTGYAEL